MLTKKIQPEGQVDESQRQDPLKPQECYSYPHHPHPPRTPPILTTLPEAVAAQLVRQMIRLAEKPSAKREAVDIPAKTHGLLLCPRH